MAIRYDCGVLSLSRQRLSDVSCGRGRRKRKGWREEGRERETHTHTVTPINTSRRLNVICTSILSSLGWCIRGGGRLCEAILKPPRGEPMSALCGGHLRYQVSCPHPHPVKPQGNARVLKQEINLLLGFK